MRALTVRPGVPDSAEIRDVPEPPESDGPLLVQTLAVGLCGTDAEIVPGDYGRLRPARTISCSVTRTSAGCWPRRAAAASPRATSWSAIVRRPDPVPCPACAAGEWDMCRNGRYTEHGIKQLHGFARERWRASPTPSSGSSRRWATIGVLLEPTTILAKAWEQVERDRRSGAPAHAARAVVTGAGPIGLLAALLGMQRGLEVHVLDRVPGRAQAGAGQGARRHLPLGVAARDRSESGRGDRVHRCRVRGDRRDELHRPGRRHLPDRRLPGGPVAAAGRRVAEPDGRPGERRDRRQRERQPPALRGWRPGAGPADTGWLGRLVTRRLPLEKYADGLDRKPTDVKVVLTVSDEAAGS